MILSRNDFEKITTIKNTDYGVFVETKTDICRYGEAYKKDEYSMERYLDFYYRLYLIDTEQPMNKPQCEVDPLKSKIKPIEIRKYYPGFVGNQFAKKANDKDIILMVELRNEHAAVYNSKLLPINQRIDKLNKKYRVKL